MPEEKIDASQIGGGQNIDDKDSKSKLGEGTVVEGKGGDKHIPDTGELDSGLKDLMVKRGFTTTEQLIEHVQKQEQKITDLSTKSRLADYSRPATTVAPRVEDPPAKIEIPDNLADLTDDRDKFQTYANKLVQTAEDRAVNKMRKERDEENDVRIFNTAQRLIRKDPEKFEKLRPTMGELHKQYPGAPLDDLYAEAEIVHEQNVNKAMDEIKTKLGLDGVDLAQLKTVLSKVNKGAPIGDTGGSAGGGAEIVTMDPNKMTVQERKDVIKKSIFGETASVLRDDEPK